jgi:hypothetical protein
MAFAVTRLLPPLLLLWSALGALALGSAAPFLPPARAAAADAASEAAMPAEAGSSAPAEAPPGLLGIRSGPRSAALIDGAWVDVGQQARGARLVSVTREGAHLTHPDGRREFLPLNPEARWTPHRPLVKEKRP